jgi:hypothetical protein
VVGEVAWLAPGSEAANTLALRPARDCFSQAS